MSHTTPHSLTTFSCPAGPVTPYSSPLISDPWDRQPGEPNRWYARFERYRLAGPSRSILGVFNAERAERGIEAKPSPSGAWKRAYVRWHWRERAEASDEHERFERRVSQAWEAEKMNRRHARQCLALQKKALRGLRALEPDDMSAGEVLRCLVEAIKIERTARGQPETLEAQRMASAAFALSLEDVVNAQKELEEWRNGRWQSAQGEALLEGHPHMP